MSGGLPQTLCDLPSLAVGGSWNRDGDIIVGNLLGGLLKVRETGGTATPVTTLDASKKEEVHLLPTFLPDGRHFVYMRLSSIAADHGGIYVGTLEAKPEEQSRQPLMPYEVGLTYVPASDSEIGRLLFVREGTLMAQPFDANRRALAGEPVAVAQRVGSFRDGGFFSASANDVLVYRTEPDFQITWFDRQGAVAGHVSEPGGFRGVALSPDGGRAVASRTDPQDTAKADLWLFDLGRGGATRLTLGTGLAESPVWSPDGTRITFTFNHSTIRQKRSSGEGEEIELLRTPTAGIAWASGWSPDGRFLVYTGSSPTSRSGSPDLFLLPAAGRQPVPYVVTPFVEGQARFSPNGHWTAYVSNQSGADEVYVREFRPDVGGGVASTGAGERVSRGGGTAPRWRGDGRELFYLAQSGTIMAAEVTASPELRVGEPTPLFQAPPGSVVGDVSADGKRFLFVTPVAPSGAVPFTVVLNWPAGLKK